MNFKQHEKWIRHSKSYCSKIEWRQKTYYFDFDHSLNITKSAIVFGSITQRKIQLYQKVSFAYFSKNLRAPVGEPRYATRPSASRSTESNIANTSDEGWWMVQMAVFPRCDVSVRSIWTTLAALKLSRPDVGSSQSSRGGSVTIFLEEKIKYVPQSCY
jgi:hypothetical protein